jgi:hypothetical protein
MATLHPFSSWPTSLHNPGDRLAPCEEDHPPRLGVEESKLETPPTPSLARGRSDLP